MGCFMCYDVSRNFIIFKDFKLMLKGYDII